MDPLVEASGGQEQYYMKGLIPWNGPPSRGIWWSRAVLHGWALSAEWTPIGASGGQEQYYVNELIPWNGPPLRGIWWCRAVLQKVIMTLGYSLGHTDI